MTKTKLIQFANAFWDWTEKHANVKGADYVLEGGRGLFITLINDHWKTDEAVKATANSIKDFVDSIFAKAIADATAIGGLRGWLAVQGITTLQQVVDKLLDDYLLSSDGQVIIGKL